MRRIRFAGVVALLILSAVTASAVQAAQVEQGSNILAIQLTEGRVDLAEPISGGYLTSFSAAPSEVGLQVQFWHFFREEYAFNLAGGIGTYSETDQSSVPGNQDIKYSQSSFQLRIGGDRVAHITPRFHIFAGPGIQFWSGRWKIEGGGSPTFEAERTNRLALSGRIAVHLKIGESFGTFGQLGHYIGYAWASDGDSKAHWWASGHDGAAGLAFNF